MSHSCNERGVEGVYYLAKKKGFNGSCLWWVTVVIVCIEIWNFTMRVYIYQMIAMMNNICAIKSDEKIADYVIVNSDFAQVTVLPLIFTKWER